MFLIFCCCSAQRFKKQKYSETTLCLCSPLLCVLSTATRGTSRRSRRKGLDTENHLLMEVQRYFSPEESASSKQAVLGDNDRKETPRKISLPSKQNRSSGGELEFIRLHDMEVASPLKNRIKKERSTEPRKKSRGEAKQLGDGSHL